jgi:hypothetical protein
MDVILFAGDFYGQIAKVVWKGLDICPVGDAEDVAVRADAQLATGSGHFVFLVR